MHDGKPACFAEYFIIMAVKFGRILIVCDPRFQAVRDLHILTIFPERCVLTLCRVVMQHEEISDLLIFGFRSGIEIIDVGLGKVLIWEVRHKSGDSGLDEVN